MANDMFRPPFARYMRILDRPFFKRNVPLKAARVLENMNISHVRSELEKSKDALRLDRLASVHPDPDGDRAKAGKKCILLRPERRLDVASDAHPHGTSNEGVDDADRWPHSFMVTELVKQNVISIIPFDLHLDYSYWTYHDIISAILPKDEQGEIPSGFSQVGHVAHLNLRDEYLKYKHLIAEILMDKNRGIGTVINKIDDVGGENQYRTFKYEVLAGPDNLNVTISEENCTFSFDYSKVYWNSRLNTEHRRIVAMFGEGEAVCDVMAGIGPFAVPAGKKGVFVWANDLNPESYASLRDSIARNKVHQYVRPFNQDGRSFIRTSAVDLLNTNLQVDIMSKPSRKDAKEKLEALRTIQQPKIFQHYIMNLPASALNFLPSFIGLYPPEVRSQLPHNTVMPMVHVHCFSTKSDDNVEEGVKICQEISGLLKHELKPGRISDGGVAVYDVRDVAPKKRMFCASFRLPEKVAYGEPS